MKKGNGGDIMVHAHSHSSSCIYLTIFIQCDHHHSHQLSITPYINETWKEHVHCLFWQHDKNSSFLSTYMFFIGFIFVLFIYNLVIYHLIVSSFVYLFFKYFIHQTICWNFIWLNSNCWWFNCIKMSTNQ